MSKIKTYVLVEDEPEIRRDTEECLSANAGLKCIGSLESVEKLLDQLSQDHVPDLVMMDINLPGMSGIDGTRLVKERFPEIEIVMLTNYDDSKRVFDALCAGASGYLLKTSSFSEINSSIDLLLRGGAPMSPPIARKVLTYFRDPSPQPRSSPLTDREQEVVQGLVDGLSYKMIADRMGIAPGTVYTHIKHIYKKLHVNSKAEVITKSLSLSAESPTCRE